MKLAILVMCHKNPEQINLFLDAMKHPSIRFFIHVDKKSTIKDSIVKREDVVLLPDKLSVDVQWGRISQVDATLNLLRYAQSKGQYDYYWLCSGQDFPIKPVDQIVQFFEENREFNFINFVSSRNWGEKQENCFDKRYNLYYPQWMMGRESWKRLLKRTYVEFTGGYNKTYWLRRKNTTGLDFYIGSQWWCLRHETIKWMLEYIANCPGYYHFLLNVVIPDECCFHTLYMNSPYANQRREHLLYIDWTERKNSPKTLRIDDYENISKSSCLMARKFDMDIDRGIIDRFR